MDEAFLGMILPWTAPFVPKNWLPCDGRTMDIRTNAALYSLIGIAYGGDGVNTFKLPNLSARFPVGRSPGGSLGAAAGNYAVTLTADNLPSHSHGVNAPTVTLPTALDSGEAAAPAPFTSGSVLGNSGAPTFKPYSNATPDTQIGGLAVKTTVTCGDTGSAAQIPVMPPYQAVTYIICVAGYYPSFS